MVIALVTMAAGVAEARPCPRVARGAVRPLATGGARAPGLDESFALVRVGGALWSARQGALDPCKNAWTPAPPTGSPLTIDGLRAVDATRIARWHDGAGWLFDGARWRPIASTGAPPARQGAVVTWIGDRVLVWGGADAAGVPSGDGAIYDVAGDRWTALPTASAPSARVNAAWGVVGGRVIVWGGESGARGAGGVLRDGASYDPVAGAWAALPVAGAPGDGIAITILDDGGDAVVWSQFRGDGARLARATSTWTPLPRLPSAGPGAVLRAVDHPGLFAHDSGGGLYRLRPGAAAWQVMAVPAPIATARWTPRIDGGALTLVRTAPRPGVALEVAILAADDTWTLVPLAGAAPAATAVDVRPPGDDGVGPLVHLAARAVHVLDLPARRWRTTRLPAGPWWAATAVGDFVVVWGRPRHERHTVTQACGCEGVRQPGDPGCDPMECLVIEDRTVIDPAGRIVRWR